MNLKGRRIFQGKASGEALVTKEAISFYGGVDPETATVVEKGHQLEGQRIAGKVLCFPKGKGSTVGSYVLYQLKKTGKAPAAIVNKECEAIVAVGCIISEIVAVDRIDIDRINTGDVVEVDGDNGVVTVK
ncbi:MAG: DUF126 domain-containing protein [Aigarchaeota archaeon]|nr:DUF126 domain-containing protein [Aigarchaeota archaeon]